MLALFSFCGFAPENVQSEPRYCNINQARETLVACNTVVILCLSNISDASDQYSALFQRVCFFVFC